MTACTHRYEPCAVPDYERCSVCHSFHSLTAPDPETIYADGYWDWRGHSSIRDQVHNVDVHEEYGRTKNRCVLDAIEVDDRSAALEIGCAPGVLLRRLREDAGFECVTGIEVDRSYENDIREIGAHIQPLLFGYFPEVTRNVPHSHYSLIVGIDIFEHVHEPEAFLNECARLLKTGGQLILMLPLVGSGDCTLPDRFFDSSEHVFLHSMSHMQALLRAAGLETILFSGWTAGHELVTAWLP